MKAFYLLFALLPLGFAKAACECPLVNCLGDDLAVSLSPHQIQYISTEDPP